LPLSSAFTGRQPLPNLRLWACGGSTRPSGTNALDSSGLGNNGTLAGENGNLPGRAPGQAGFGNALVLTNDGANHAYVTIPGAPCLMIGQTATNAWSITAWVFESSEGTTNFIAEYGRILNIDDGNAFQFESGEIGDAEMYTWSELTGPWQVGWGVGTSVAPLLDQWVHWAVVYDGTNLTVYRNGNQGAQGGISSTPVYSPLAFSGYTGSILIGSELDQPAAATWNGMLDDIAVFAGALSQSQIATVMLGNFAPFIGGAPGIVSGPQSQAVQQGSSASFTVGPSGQAPFRYQWYFGTNAISAVSNPTATNATLVLNNLQLSQSGAYSVVVSNSISSVASSPATLVVFEATLVGLWRFNEDSGTNALDSSGLGNNGALAGENGNVPARVAGKPGFGGALYFTNDNVNHAYVAIPANGSLAIGQTVTNPWTITAWAFEDSGGSSNFVATYGRIMVIDDGTAFQLESGAINDAEMYTWARADAGWQVAWGIGSSVSPLLDRWVHWAVVYDGTNLTIYRNGNTGPEGGIASQPVNAALGGYLGYQDAILIGSELAQPGNRTWNGMLDDIAVFNIPLSPAQIQTVMSGDFSAFVPRPVLSIVRGPAQTVFSWSALQPTFQLQSASDVRSASWTNVSTAAVVNGSTMTVTLPTATVGAEYFRLIGP
jgi:hypothetical protein